MIYVHFFLHLIRVHLPELEPDTSLPASLSAYGVVLAQPEGLTSWDIGQLEALHFGQSADLSQWPDMGRKRNGKGLHRRIGEALDLRIPSKV